jgi:hypothetical protein
MSRASTAALYLGCELDRLIRTMPHGADTQAMAYLRNSFNHS